MSAKLVSSYSPFSARLAGPNLLNFCRCNSAFAGGARFTQAEDQRFRSFRHRENRGEKLAQGRAHENKIKALEKNQTRDFKTGDIYSPHDLSPEEMMKWRKRKSPSTDIFDALAMNPLDHYKNFSIMSEYMSDMGRIKPITETGLRPVNQRRMAKALKRAIGLGLMPSVHKHPEILMLENKL